MADLTPEALAPLPKFLGHPDDLCDQWLGESYELDEGDPAWDREDMQSAYREGRDEARRQLAPAHAALTAERDELRATLERMPAESWAKVAAERDQWREEATHSLTTALAARDQLDKALAGLAQARQAHDTWAAQLTAERDAARIAERERIQGLFGEWITIAMSEPNSHPPEAWKIAFADPISDKPQFPLAAREALDGGRG